MCGRMLTFFQLPIILCSERPSRIKELPEEERTRWETFTISKIVQGPGWNCGTFSGEERATESGSVI